MTADVLADVAVRRARPDHDVGLSAVPVEQQRPDRQKRCARRASGLLGNGVHDPGGDLDAVGHRFAALLAEPGQVESHRTLRQPAFPVLPCHFVAARLRRPGRAHREGRKFRCRVGDLGRVQRGEIADQQVFGPLVEGDPMHHHAEEPGVRAAPHEGDAQDRTVGEIDRHLSAGPQNVDGLALRVRHLVGELEVPGGVVDHLHRCSGHVGEPRAQGLMARPEPGEGGFQRRGVDIAGQPPGNREVVGGTVRTHLREEPQSTLERRGRLRRQLK